VSIANGRNRQPGLLGNMLQGGPLHLHEIQVLVKSLDVDPTKQITQKDFDGVQSLIAALALVTSWGDFIRVLVQYSSGQANTRRSGAGVFLESGFNTANLPGHYTGTTGNELFEAVKGERDQARAFAGDSRRRVRQGFVPGVSIAVCPGRTWSRQFTRMLCGITRRRARALAVKKPH
jgi:hypothetical protein